MCRFVVLGLAVIARLTKNERSICFFFANLTLWRRAVNRVPDERRLGR
jgi:hypothetical protein